LLGAVLNALGPDPSHLQRSLTTIFVLVSLAALLPATLLRPRVAER
jgi:hypothetical protein